MVRTPTGEVRFDPTGRLAGRGAYLCRDSACWSRAIDRGGVPRALGVEPSPALRALLEAGPDGATNDTMTTTDTTTTTTRTED